MKDDESRMEEEEPDDIEEPDEVYSNMLRKVKKDESEEECPDSNDDVQEKISDKDFYDDASYSPSKVTDWQGPTHTQYDFLVFLPNRVIRIAQDSYLSWLTLFYEMPIRLIDLTVDVCYT